MLNFLKWFKKKEPEVKEKTVSLFELEPLISDLRKQEFSGVHKRAEGIKSDINSYFKEVSRAAEKLKEGKISVEMDLRLKNRVLVGRDNLAGKSIFVSKRLLGENLDIDNWESLLSFREKIAAGLKELTNVLAKNGVFIETVFKKELAALREIFKKISLALKELDAVIAENREKIEQLFKIRENSKEMTEAWGRLKQLKKELGEREKELSDLNKNEELLDKKIKQTEGSEAFKEKIIAEKEVRDLRKAEDKLKQELRNETNMINKALKKYMHQQGVLLSKDRVKTVEMFAAEPIESLVSDKSEEMLEILEDMRKLIEADKIGFDEKTREKILDNIKNIPEIFEKIKTRFNEISSSEKELEEKIKKMHDKDYENMLETIKVSKKWAEEIKAKISDLKMMSGKEKKKFESLKNDVLENLNNQFSFKIIIQEIK